MFKFEKIVLFTSMIIAICAASFSIYGIGLLFSGAAIAAMIMASTLELGKLVTTSWLFKNWKIANPLMKIYMIFAVIVLMGITSLGVFGYLSSAYQKSSLENQMREEKINTFSTTIQDSTITIENYQKEIEKLYESKKSQEDRLSETLNNTLIARNPVQLQTIQGQINSQIEQMDFKISEIGDKIEQLTKTINDSNQEILSLKIEQSEQKDITTFKFVADEFNTGINTIAKWFIFVIIAVFDPLAVVLLMAATLMTSNSKDDDSKQHPTSFIPTSSPLPPTPSTSTPLHQFKTTHSAENVIEELPTSTEKSIKEIEKPVEVVREVVKEVEKPVEVVKEVVKEVEKPVEVVKEVVKEVEKPVEVVKEVVKEVEKPVEVVREVIVPSKKNSKMKGMFSF